MLDIIKHINSQNEVLDFIAAGIYLNENDLRDFEWTVTTKNDRITGFKKGVTTKTLSLQFVCNNEQEAAAVKNNFYEHFEIDVLRAAPGYFEINGYKYNCYVIKSAKSEYLANKRLLVLKLTITTDDDAWIKETTHTLDFKELQEADDALKYTFNYPFTYRRNSSVNIINTGLISTEGIIRIYGPAINPLVKIDANVYQVNETLESNEFLEINTKEKSIYKFSSYGDKTNIFNLRNKNYNVFEPIPAGAVNVSANDEFKVDIVCRERRGEPRWN